MRILLLTPEFQAAPGGIVTFYNALLPALQAQGVEARVIEGSALFAAEEASPRVYNGVRVETLERARLASWFRKFDVYASMPLLRSHLAAAWAMWEQADYGKDTDLVEACDWGMLFVPPTIAATHPLLIQCHGSTGQIALHDPIGGEEAAGRFIRLIEQAALGLNGTIQTHSQANADFWRQETGRDVVMVRPVWQALPASGLTETSSDRGLVVGRLQRWKGAETVCEALRQLGERGPAIDWIGREVPISTRNRPMSSHLAQTYSDVWEKKLFHRPPLPRADIRALQSRALFNLIPSTWDVFNFTVLEAMASGRPAVVSAGAGASELIEHGVNGYVFPPGDAGRLAEIVDEILAADPARLRAIALAAQDTLRTALDPKQLVEQRLAVYHRTIEAFRIGRPPPPTGSLADVCRPADSASADQQHFFEQFPLRDLIAHSAGRIRRKVSRAW